MKTSITVTFKEPYSIDAKLSAVSKPGSRLSYSWRNARGEGRQCLHTLLFQFIQAVLALCTTWVGIWCISLPSCKVFAPRESLHAAGGCKHRAQVRGCSVPPPEGVRRRHSEPRSLDSIWRGPNPPTPILMLGCSSWQKKLTGSSACCLPPDYSEVTSFGSGLSSHG